MSPMKIPFYKRTWTNEEVAAVTDCLKSGLLTQGRLVEEFEEAFKNYVGSKFAIAVNSCTSALFLCLSLLKPKTAGIPSMTFASVASSILQSGAKLLWRDESWSGARYPLHLKGAKPGRIYDSAHSIHRGDAKNCRNDLICYSFFPTKNLSSAEGGMIATNNKKYAEWLKKARWHARVGKTWDYVIEFPAWKMNMTNIQAAIGLDYLKRLDAENKKRQELVDKYNMMFDASIRSDHIYQTIVNKRDEFAAFMADNGVECSVHFKPLHLQPAFKKYSKTLRKTEHFAMHIVSLPLFPSLKEEDVDYICGLVKGWNKKYPLPEEDFAEFEDFLRQ